MIFIQKFRRTEETDRENTDRKTDTQTEKTDIQTEKTDKKTIDRDLEVRICASLYLTIKNKMDDIKISDIPFI